MHQHLENCSCPNLLPFLKSLQPIPDTLSSFSSEAVDTIQLRRSPLYTACLLPEDCWNHMTASHSEVFLLEGTTSKWQYIIFVRLQQSQQQQQNISRAAWKLAFSLAEGSFATLFMLSASPAWELLLPLLSHPRAAPFSNDALISSLELLQTEVRILLSLPHDPAHFVPVQKTAAAELDLVQSM